MFDLKAVAVKLLDLLRHHFDTMVDKKRKNQCDTIIAL
jgi:hypothetical protein